MVRSEPEISVSLVLRAVHPQARSLRRLIAIFCQHLALVWYLNRDFLITEILSEYNLDMKVAVIGAGASGIMAALEAAWQGAAVTLFEHNATVGRKILVSGSGRCNITNTAVEAGKYACADTSWMETLLGCFGVGDLITLLATIGILVEKTADGWCYPLSYSAHSVVEALSSALTLAGVTDANSTHVNAIHRTDTGFVIGFSHQNQQQDDQFEQVIVSAGGAAYPTLGSRGELFPVLAELGHSVLPNRPALAPILADLGALRSLQGIRLNVGTALWNGSVPLAATTGNLIFTKWGLNGPAVMDISHHVTAHSGGSLVLSLNFLAIFRDEFNHLLAQKRNSAMPAGVFLSAFLPPKVVQTILNIAHLGAETPLSQMDNGALKRMMDQLTNTRLSVQGVRGFEYCQVSAGGVPVREVDPCTLESHLIKGLYLTGEILDVVGPCGGYNLQFAFSSGVLAGRAAAGQGSDRTQY